MFLPRRHRYWVVLIACFHLLFAQVALAQYACPGLAAVVATTASTAIDSPCDELMAASPTSQPLCKAHCKADPQSSHTPAMAVVAMPALLAIVAVPAVLALPPSGLTQASPPWMQRNVHPPLAVRHCCLRL